MNTKIETTVATALHGLDKNTLVHSRRVQEIALLLGESMGLNSEELKDLSLGALLHDVGKREVSLDILEKESFLSAEEWEIIELHPVLGHKSVAETALSDEVKEVIHDHHLWYNGEGGYPLSETGKPSLLTTITTVADVLDAMTQDRPYRKALSLSTSVSFLEDRSGSQFSPSVVEYVLRSYSLLEKLVNS